MGGSDVNKQSTGWKEVRLFISSTFKDMQAERDYLVRFIFPKIREELLKYRVYFVDIDLRWGLTSEDDVVGACRTIIDECRPLFLGILGGRYGWVPKQLKDNVSVTEDEIEHAMNNFKNGDYQRLFFLMRDEKATLSMVESTPGEYMEPAGSPNAKKLALLKEGIKESEFPCRTYSALWDNDSKSLTNLQEFGNMVYDFIHSFIEETFGAGSLEFTNQVDEDDAVTEQFISNKNRFFISEGLEDPLDKIKSLSQERKSNNVIMVTGQCGIGKSAFLCRFIQDMIVKDNLYILPHFIGVTTHSGELDGTLRRLCQLLSRHSNLKESIPIELDKLIFYFKRLLASLDPDKKFILVIDALDQLSENYSAHELRWLPNTLPSNVTLIISTNSKSITDAAKGLWDTLYELELKGMNQNASHLMVDHYLSRYQKHLSREQIDCLLSKGGSYIPLYLSTIIEEMRIYGSYEGLMDFIGSLPDETVPLLEWIMNTRISSSKEFTDSKGQPVGKTLVKRYLSLLYISQEGLSENELIDLLGDTGANGNMSALTRQLRPFLTFRGELLTFYHDDIKKAIYNCYIQDTDIKMLHRELFEYFHTKADPKGDNSWSSYNIRHFHQLLYHGINSLSYEALDSLILSGFFKSYSKIETPIILMGEIRRTLDFFGSDPDFDHCDAIVSCLLIYSEISRLTVNTAFDHPHEMERALAEGRDDDVLTLLSSSGRGFKSAALRCAANTMYNIMGRAEKAPDMEPWDNDEIRGKETPYPLSLLYDSLTKPGEEVEPKDESTETPDDDTSIDDAINPKTRIPVSHIFSATAIGTDRFVYGACLGFVMFCINLFIFSPLYKLLDQIKLWAANYGILGKGVVFIATIAFGLPVILIPYFLVKALQSKLEGFLRRNSEDQVKAMVKAADNLTQAKRLRHMLRLARYTRLLSGAEIDDYYWSGTFLNNLFTWEVMAFAESRRYNDAGLLAACIMNSGKSARSALALKLKTLNSEILYDVMLSMLKNIDIIKSKLELLYFIIDVYGNTPPVVILLETLVQQKNDKSKEIIKVLQGLDKSILATSLLRTTSLRKNSWVRWLSELKISRIKANLLVEPIPYSPGELLVKSPFLTAIIFGIGVMLFFGMVFGFLAFLFGLAPYLMWNVFNDWAEKKKLPDDIGLYQEELLSARSPDNSSLQRDSLRSCAAVETALVQALMRDKTSPRSILNSFSQRVVIRVWKTLLRPGFANNRSKLLCSLIYASDVLSKLMKSILKTHNTKTYTPQEKSHSVQWKRMRLDTPAWKSSLKLTLLCGIVYVLCTTVLYATSEPWVSGYFLSKWWLPLIPALYGALVPYKIIRYAPFALLVVLSIILSEDLMIPTLIIYTLLPSLSLIASNEAINKWRCTRQLYPGKVRQAIGKLRAAVIILAGVIIISGLNYYITDDDMVFLKNSSAKNTLYNYSTIKNMKRSSMSLYDNTIWEKLIPLTNENELYKKHILRHVNTGIAIYNTRLALEKNNRFKEAQVCREKLSEFAGWCDAFMEGSGMNQRSVFRDINGNVVPVYVVITYVNPGDSGELLGILKGDIIESIGDAQIISIEDVSRLLTQNYKKGAPFSIIIRRNQSQIRLIANTDKLGVALGVASKKFVR